MTDATAQDQAYREFVNTYVAERCARLKRMLGSHLPHAHEDWRKYLPELRQSVGSAIRLTNNKNLDLAQGVVLGKVIPLWLILYDAYQNKGKETDKDGILAMLDALGEDIDHHFEKHGYQRLDAANWFMVLGEEEGEAIAEMQLRKDENARKEVMQVLACWFRFASECERERQGIAYQERRLYVKAV